MSDGPHGGSQGWPELATEDLGLRVPGGGRWLLRHLELRLGQGELLVLVGPNGSGKTSLLRALLGLARASEGRVTLAGRGVVDEPARRRARSLAWLPQRSEIPWSMTSASLVMLGRAPHLAALAGPGDDDHRAVEQALERVGARALHDRDVRTLSGGELQRVLLARLLATQTPFLLLDEPTTALDVGHALALLELCRELTASGCSVVASLHELELARRYGDRALLLHGDEGGSFSLGPVDEVLTPARLREVFGVEVTLAGGQLRFAPGGGSQR